MGWNNPPSKLMVSVLSDADTLTKKVTGEILQKVVVASPVDTGQFRNNWVVGVNHLNTSTTTETDKSGQGSISKGIATIASGGGIGKIAYLSNSLKYGVKLNDGHSQQAPINFVELSVQSVLNKYK